MTISGYRLIAVILKRSLEAFEFEQNYVVNYHCLSNIRFLLERFQQNQIKLYDCGEYLTLRDALHDCIAHLVHLPPNITFDLLIIMAQQSIAHLTYTIDQLRASILADPER
jgi:hypothetical protein